MMNKKAKTKKELLDEMTALQQELANFQSANAGLEKDKKALGKREKFLSGIFSSILEGITVLDPDLNILFVNPTMERWFPDVRPLIGKKCYQVYHGRDQVCEDCPCRQTLQTGQDANAVIPRLDAKGDIFGWYHHFSFPMLDPGTGRIIGVIEYIRNVTKRKQAEDALKESEEKYRSILENLADSYFETDLAGKFTFVNDAMARTFGYTKEELLVMSSRGYSDEENANKIYQVFNRVYRTGEPAKGIQYETITKKGERRSIETSASLIKDPSGKPIGFRGIARDISELRQAQIALQQSEEKYRSILENLADGYYEVDLAGNFTILNNELAKIYGNPREALIGINNRVYTDEENAKKMYQAFNRVYRTGEADKDVRIEIITSEKIRKNMDLSISLIRDASGNPVGFRGIARDITDFMQAQRELKASEERYRTIIETIEEGYYENDLAGNLTFVNEAMARVLGYSRAELQGMNNRQYVDDENSKILYQAFNRVYRTGEPAKGIQYEVMTKNGEKRTVETSASLIRNALGNPVGFRGISRDITDLIQAQHALKESEERYRTIIETIEDGYYEVDLAGNLTYFNDAMARINGYSRAEMQGMNNRQYTDAKNARIIYQTFVRIFRTGEPAKAIQYEVITKNGERKSLETSASLIRDPSGNPIGFRGIARDVSELRQAEKALQTSEERFRVAAESSNDFIYEWDIKSGRIDWSGTAGVKLGHILGELPVTAVDFDRLIHSEDHERFSEAVINHLRHGKPYLEEYRMIGKDGNIIHLSAAGMCLRNEDGRAFKWIGALSDITERKRSEEELKESLAKLHKAMGGIIQAIALTVESKDPYTAGHQQRVSNLGRSIAQEMGLSKDQIEAIRMAGVVHDLGKISVPAEILSKPTKLSDLEFSLIKGHSQTSYDILKDIEFPWPIAEIALQHHERMDGSGYPSGLKGEEILIEAQVLMVADVVEAIASHRPYRPALGIEAALDEISKNKEKLYNPAAVDACVRLFREKEFSFS